MNDTSLTSSQQPVATQAGLWPSLWRSMLKPARVLLLPGANNLGHAQQVSTDMPVPALDVALLAWRDWCQHHAGQRCKLALSSAWVMTGLVPDSAQAVQATTSAQAIEHMAQQWDHYLGLGAAALNRDWLVRTTRVSQGWLVCATPRQLVDDLLMVAKHHRVSVVWMGPWWTQGLQRWVRKPRAESLHMVEPGWCLHVVTDKQGPTMTRVWSEPVVAGHVPEHGASSAPHVVALGRHGAAASACVWDDAVTQDLIDGRASAWLGQGALP